MQVPGLQLRLSEPTESQMQEHSSVLPVLLRKDGKGKLEDPKCARQLAWSVCMYIHMCTYIHTYMYIYIYTHYIYIIYTYTHYIYERERVCVSFFWEHGTEKKNQGLSSTHNTNTGLITFKEGMEAMSSSLHTLLVS